MSRVLDFNQVKAEATFEQILEHYGVMVPGSGRQRMTLCPFHPDKRPSCSINLDRKVFHCFGCGAHGSILDFVALSEEVSIHEASIRVADICGLHRSDRDRVPQKFTGVRLRSCEVRQHTPKVISPLQGLDPTHPYLLGRGITPELATTFGLGYCADGIMHGRICIPIHDDRGTLAAYAGRFASAEIPKGVIKYYLPAGFEKRRVLFGLHRVKGAEHLVLVEGYWSVFRLHTLGIPAVALMGRSLSTEQEALLLNSNVQKLTLLLDGDQPGREATDQLVPRLAEHFLVRDGNLPDRAEPDTVPEEFLLDVLS